MASMNTSRDVPCPLHSNRAPAQLCHPSPPPTLSPHSTCIPSAVVGLSSSRNDSLVGSVAKGLLLLRVAMQGR
ncbi:hypothetical protein E2C01_029194 [Portunus trituberculatus]|uniref:Uncharacterized protein n=1 Tax=Portunus trituberculatus TaxID=210409 RepID=A0A5B7ERL3_PORTR|nr:hypothetical protein [Portunus trituberculatus]